MTSQKYNSIFYDQVEKSEPKLKKTKITSVAKDIKKLPKSKKLKKDERLYISTVSK